MATIKEIPEPVYVQHMQHQHWRFSGAELRARRAEALYKSSTRIPQGSADDIEGPMTVEEQQDLCIFYESRIVTFCRTLKYSDNVMATAVSFFKRFYLTYSVLDHSPASLVLPCLYLALKAEDNFLPLDQFLVKVKKTPENGKAILAMEFTLSRALKFQWTLRHSFRPLYGFFLDAQRFTKDRVTLRKVYKEAKIRVRTSILTDAPFLFSPSQIALAAFLGTIAKNKTDFDGYGKSIFGSQGEGHVDLKAAIASIDAITDAYTLPGRERATKCDAKRKTLAALIIANPPPITELKREREGDESSDGSDTEGQEPPHKKIHTE